MGIHIKSRGTRRTTLGNPQSELVKAVSHFDGDWARQAAAMEAEFEFNRFHQLAEGLCDQVSALRPNEAVEIPIAWSRDPSCLAMSWMLTNPTSLTRLEAFRSEAPQQALESTVFRLTVRLSEDGRWQVELRVDDTFLWNWNPDRLFNGQRVEERRREGLAVVHHDLAGLKKLSRSNFITETKTKLGITDN